MQGRGLKRPGAYDGCNAIWSPLMQGRGLKHLQIDYIYC